MTTSNTTMREHLKDRFCNTDLYGRSVIVDEENRVITFLLWNFSGQLIGYQQYRPDNHEKAVKNHPDKRYYLFVGDEGGDIQKKSKRKAAMFGIETIKRFPLGPVLLVEGIFDAVRLHSAGFCAIALLTSNPKKLKSFLSTIHRPKISICDGDPAGSCLAKYGDYAIHLPAELDVGDLSNDQFVFLKDQIRSYVKFENHQQGKLLPYS